jgi:predicted transcriptional regulator
MAPQQSSGPVRLERAKQFLAIAEAVDADPKKAKRSAYMACAEEIAAHIDETGDSQPTIAIVLGCTQQRVSKLLLWRKRGYDTESPYDEGPEKRQQHRARVSHGKRVLKEQPEDLAEEIEESVDKLPQAVVDRIAEKAHQTTLKRSKAKREEHAAPKATPPAPTVGDVLEKDETAEDLQRDLTQWWADKLIIRLDQVAHELTALREASPVGLTLGALSYGEAIERLANAERNAGEARAEAQERVNEEAMH